MNSSVSVKQNGGSIGSLTMSVVDSQTCAENGKKFTKYKVLINHNGRIWDVWHRYSEFNSLHDKIRRIRSDLKLPGRRILGDSFEREFVVKRQQGLDRYVQIICEEPQLTCLPEFIEFFAFNTVGLTASTNLNKSKDVRHDKDKLIDAKNGDSSTSNDEIRVNLGDKEKILVKPTDFEFRKCIGKGSFGKVYLARHKAEDTIYAVKVVSKALIKRKREEHHIMAERNVLVKNMNHPFLVSLQYSFQTPDKLFFVMEFVNGGELFFHLQKERSFPESRARFYAAEIACAIGYLHQLDIIYRDLKPENILLDRDGHIRLTDFGLCKVMLSSEGREARTSTFCGTPEYLAPEVLRREAYTKAVDWWCLGSVIYEMLCARPPFYSRDVSEMYDNIQHRSLRFVGNVSDRARRLIEELLRKVPHERLGSGIEDVAEIKRQPFFEQIDWEKLEARKLNPPWKPSIKDSLSIDAIAPEFTEEPVSLSLHEPTMGSMTNKDPLFKDFTYVHDKMMNS